MYGRKRLYTDYSYIDETNILEVLKEAYNSHLINRGEINTLYDYYKGKQAVLNKTKEIREDINHKIIVNRANEIVSFKLGYTMGEPIQYIRRANRIETEEVSALNDILIDLDKMSCDRTLAEWLYVCGIGYRMVLPDKDNYYKLSMYTLDPRSAFVVYENGLGDKPLLGVKYVEKINGTQVFYCYTDNAYFLIENWKIKAIEPHTMGMVNIIEYNANTTRLGSFEVVMPLLDAINEIESNRLDDIVQFVNSFLVMTGGVTLDENIYKQIQDYKMFSLPENGDAKYLAQTLNQAEIQTYVDNLYNAVLTICGLPNRNQGGGSSDNGIAVYLRDGFQCAETQALAFEQMFKHSEYRFIELLLRILNITQGFKITKRDIEIKFARRYTDNILTKTQALTMLLDAGVAPSIAIATSGIWNDSYSVYDESRKTLEKWEDTNEAIRTDRQNDRQLVEENVE